MKHVITDYKYHILLKKQPSHKIKNKIKTKNSPKAKYINHSLNATTNQNNKKILNSKCTNIKKQCNLIDKILNALDFGKIERIDSSDFDKLGELSVLQKYIQIVKKFMSEKNDKVKMKLWELIHKYEIKILSARVSSHDKELNPSYLPSSTQYFSFKPNRDKYQNHSRLSEVRSVYNSNIWDKK